MERRDFLKILGLSSLALSSTGMHAEPNEAAGSLSKSGLPLSDFSKRLRPLGRILEIPGSFVWCNSPIYDPEGKVHVFFSRWDDKYGMGGWINRCEIGHAVARNAESPFEVVGPVLSPRSGFFDATTCHNPHIQFFDGTYFLFYMGNCDGSTHTKRIGLATAQSLEGPWTRSEQPLLQPGPEGSWDDHCTTNPALLHHPNGEFWLYYKSWNTREYQSAPKNAPIKGNRKYGLAIARGIKGPYTKFAGNPVIDFSKLAAHKQLEDAFVWHEGGKFRLIARDMGFYDHSVGLLFESADGLNWSEPEIAYEALSHYVKEPPAPAKLKRYGRLERPQLLMKNGHPEYLFCAAQGGRHMTSSGFVFRIES